MPERRLHPAAVAVYSADALKNLAFPLLLIIGTTLLGGSVDEHDLRRTAIYGGVGLVLSLTSGIVRWRTTRYRVEGDVIHHRSGLLRVADTHVPVGRVEALDVHIGPLQRLFGLQAVDVQTGAGGKGGEISLPALSAQAVEELRAAIREPGAPADAPAAPVTPSGPSRTLAGRDLLLAAVTAGQLGVIVPVLAGAGQVVQQLVNSRSDEEEALSLLPDRPGVWILAVAALLLVAWGLSTLGALVAFSGFSVRRDGDRLHIRRGFVQRSEATVAVHRVRAVRVVQGLFRAPFGLAALHVEVSGYADEAAAARTLFPFVRLGEVPELLGELLPELADDPRGLARPPARARRRYLLWPTVAGLVAGAAAWVAGAGPWPLLAACVGLGYGWLMWRGAGWRLRDGRLAVSRRRLAVTTVLAPSRYRESQTVSQSLFQRRAGLASLAVAFGKSTDARVAHIEAAEARAAWESLR
jgi:putative membrane protein